MHYMKTSLETYLKEFEDGLNLLPFSKYLAITYIITPACVLLRITSSIKLEDVQLNMIKDKLNNFCGNGCVASYTYQIETYKPIMKDEWNNVILLPQLFKIIDVFRYVISQLEIGWLFTNPPKIYLHSYTILIKDVINKQRSNNLDLLLKGEKNNCD